MSSDSKNHHYIPQFHLRMFYNGSTFWRYDKKFQKFSRREITSSSVMFEKYRNTTCINGETTNQIETLYGKLETEYSDIFKMLNSRVIDEKILEYGLNAIKQYISIQFWRLPIVDDYSNNLLLNLDLSKQPSPVLINDKKLGDIPEIQNLLLNDENFRYYYRCFILPMIFNPKIWDKDNIEQEELAHWKIFNVENCSSWENQIISDLPFVYKSVDNILLFNNDFIFPINKSRILIRLNNPKSSTSICPEFTSKLSALLYAQSHRYIAGPSRSYIESVIAMYNKYWGDDQIDKLRTEVFKDLYRP